MGLIMQASENPAPARAAAAPAVWEALVQAATLAPSPDNNQPWYFELRPSGDLFLYHDAARALPSDVDGMFSFIALGAALENLSIAARQHGWEGRVSYFPAPPGASGQSDLVSPAAPSPVAGVCLDRGASADPLYPFLARRATCRKPYARRPVPGNVLRALEQELAAFRGTALHWLPDRAAIRALAGLVAAADRVRFEYRPFHEELYRQLRLSPEEAQATGDGLDARCLEIPPFGSAMLKWLRPWSRMHALNRLGMSRLLTVQSGLLTWCTGTVGLLTTAVASPEGYLESGRALQRIWLAATQHGLAFHPLGSLPIFLSRLARHGGAGLCSAHRDSLAQMERKFFRFFPQARQQSLALLFRLGVAPPPQVRSLRRPVRSVFRAV
jgi:hypothetical protein